jgi:hypothetical protein
MNYFDKCLAENRVEVSKLQNDAKYAILAMVYQTFDNQAVI